jgi:predicted NBD/HSP70 family sugar kinase
VCLIVRRRTLNVLVIDIGGSHVKVFSSRSSGSPLRFKSGKHFTPRDLTDRLKRETRLRYDVVSIGFPGATGPNTVAAEPGNLGRGWIGFDFSSALSRPVRIVNDAVLQALGGYDGGRMLFLGLGTGIGAAFVAGQVIVPLELGCLRYSAKETFAKRLGKKGREKHGHVAWNASVRRVTQMLRDAFAADYVLLGGGNAKHVSPLPKGVRRGGNRDALRGGVRLWEDVVRHHDRHHAALWRVIT